MSDVPIWYWIAGTDEDDRAIAQRVPRTGADPAADGAPADAIATMQDAQTWRQDIIDELDELDRRSIRALREGNAQRIAQIEADAQRLREHIRYIASRLQQAS
jgi:hypothetical protein